MTSAPRQDIVLGRADLARLMPMHMVVDGDGVILGAGPTLERLRAPEPVEGTRIFDLFLVRRPHGARTMQDLAARGGRRLDLELRTAPHTLLKGHFVTDWQGLFVFDLSFGIMVNDAVSAYGLTATDFAPTSLAVEMLYLLEANAAAMSESRDLNRRLHEAKAAAERLARTDALTGLCNRRGMEAAIVELAARNVPFGLLHVDLDFFKAVNDTLGHAAGDHVLTQVARILEAETRKVDLVIRLGGDEFAIICRNMLDRDRLAALATRIIATLEAPIPFDGQVCRVSVSIGVTTSDLYACPDVAGMLRDADIALYRSKEAGRSRATFFERGDRQELRADGRRRPGSGPG
jgi:diguanylate cyclase (GGDEF)-like protein